MQKAHSYALFVISSSQFFVMTATVWHTTVEGLLVIYCNEHLVAHGLFQAPTCWAPAI